VIQGPSRSPSTAGECTPVRRLSQALKTQDVVVSCLAQPLHLEPGRGSVEIRPEPVHALWTACGQWSRHVPRGRATVRRPASRWPSDRGLAHGPLLTERLFDYIVSVQGAARGSSRRGVAARRGGPEPAWRGREAGRRGVAGRGSRRRAWLSPPGGAARPGSRRAWLSPPGVALAAGRGSASPYHAWAEY
jgi:hypothetical protein